MNFFRTCFSIAALLPIMLLLSSCINVQYVGKTYPAKPSAAIFMNETEIPAKNYTVMGKAIATGSYHDYSAEDLKRRLRKKAMEKGADAVLIIDYEVLPNRYVREDQMLNEKKSNAWSIPDDSGSTITNMRQNFDYGYGDVGKTPENRVKTYKRVYRALFLHYNKD